MMPLKQRIAFVANTSWSIYKFRLPVLQAMVAKGFDVYVLAPRDKYTALFERLEGISYVELKKFKSKTISPVDDIRLYRELLKHYRQLNPSLIFHYTIKANIYGSLAAARTGCRAVSIITGLGYMFSGNKLLQLLASALYRVALKKTREVWFLNHDDRQVFISKGLVLTEKTFVLPGEGVNTTLFYPTANEEKDGPASFLLIGRLIEHKGIAEFVQAAELLLEKKLSAQFSLLGFFDDKSAVAISRSQLAGWEKKPAIAYLGETDNVIPYIEKADCIVLPSYREGMPLSLLEAASMGKAIIASDVAGCREIVSNGVNGFLCREKDAADLAAKMELYCRLPRSEKTVMGMAGRKLVTEKFEQKIVTGIYLSRLDNLMGNST